MSPRAEVEREHYVYVKVALPDTREPLRFRVRERMVPAAIAALEEAVELLHDLTEDVPGAD